MSSGEMPSNRSTSVDTASVYPTAEQSSRMVDRLFLIFDTLYGSAWSKNFKPTEIANFGQSIHDDDADMRYTAICDAWQKIITKIPIKNLEYGVERIRNGKSPYVNYPPNPLQFREFCDSVVSKPPNRPRMDGKPSSPEVAKYHLAQIREIIRNAQAKKQWTRDER